MTCKDCIHYSLCNYEEICHYDIDNIKNAKDCSFFQDRSLFVVLPCKIGTELFRIKQINGKRFITNTALNSNTFWNIVMQGEFGKTVFFTKEAAEQALKEREENETT